MYKNVIKTETEVLCGILIRVTEIWITWNTTFKYIFKISVSSLTIVSLLQVRDIGTGYWRLGTVRTLLINLLDRRAQHRWTCVGYKRMVRRTVIHHIS